MEIGVKVCVSPIAMGTFPRSSSVVADHVVTRLTLNLIIAETSLSSYNTQYLKRRAARCGHIRSIIVLLCHHPEPQVVLSHLLLGTTPGLSTAKTKVTDGCAQKSL